jgi:hypothetical protein
LVGNNDELIWTFNELDKQSGGAVKVNHFRDRSIKFATKAHIAN